MYDVQQHQQLIVEFQAESIMLSQEFAPAIPRDGHVVALPKAHLSISSKLYCVYVSADHHG
jgi:hypothetical protein